MNMPMPEECWICHDPDVSYRDVLGMCWCKTCWETADELRA